MEKLNPITKLNEEESKIKKYRQEQEEELSKLRTEIGSYTIRPLDQWSDDEKRKFCSLCSMMLNNFHLNVGKALKDVEDDGVPMKKVYKRSEEKVAKEIAYGDHSEKYFNNSKAHFYAEMRKTLLDNNVDLDVLKEMVEKNREYLDKSTEMWNDRERYIKDGSFTEEGKSIIKESNEHYCKFYLKVLPVVFDMLDNGYVKSDLTG